MFIQPCFIKKNTPELRKKLEELGYEFVPRDMYIGQHHVHLMDEDKPNLYLCTLPTYSKYRVALNKKDLPFDKGIDCGTNEELFLALAALRDDTDKYQWFTNNRNDWYKCMDKQFAKENANWVLCAGAQKWHKAAVEEIIEHFK